MAVSDGADACFGNLLRRLRRAAGLSQEELAERAGLSARGISDLERGAHATPQRVTVQLLARALGLAPADASALESSVRRVSARAVPDPDASRAKPLPVALTSLIGREREVAEVGALLRQGRPLVTLTGPGGVGKTRLALEVARHLDAQQMFPDGVRLVELAPLADATLVASAVAAALGVQGRADEPLQEALARALRTRRLLLVLDNCEHVVDAAAGLASELLRRCDDLRLLATSREALAIHGETCVVVPPLALPPAGPAAGASDPMVYPATRLFVERVREAHQGAGVGAGDAADAADVARVCRYLDGLPLAIELAAARVKGMGLRQLADRLMQDREVPAAVRRDGPARHQTLAAAIEWSVALLASEERTLFTRLGVFAGGFTLEAAEAVGADVAADEGGPAAHDGGAARHRRQGVLALLLRLVDKSLVVAEPQGDGAVRYRVLEPLRQYARERLLADDGAASVQSAHADYYLGLVEAAERQRPGVGRPFDSADRRESDNLRAALRWFREAGEVGKGLRLLETKVVLMWLGNLGEVVRWYDAFLGMDTSALPATQGAAALGEAGKCAHWHGDYARATRWHEALLALGRRTADESIVVEGLHMLGFDRWLTGQYDEATTLLEEALARRRAACAGSGRIDAQAAGAELPRTLRDLSFVHQARGDLTRAQTLLEESIAVAHRAGASLQADFGMFALVRNLSLQGNFVAAVDALRARWALDQSVYLHTYPLPASPRTLEWLAPLALALGYAELAARLLGAAEAANRQTGIARYAPHEADYQRDLARVRATLSPEAFAAAWAMGELLSTGEERGTLLLETLDLLVRQTDAATPAA